MTRRVRLVAVPLLVGALATIGVVSASGVPWRDAGELLALAAGTALVAGAGGAAALFALRGRSVGVQAVAVALTGTGGVALGAWAAAQAMFLSTHDLAALEVVLVGAGTTAVVVALVLGERVGRAGASLVATARGLGDGALPASPDPSAPQELARLAHELDASATRVHEAQARERALDSSRRELVAWVSHDLRTPLAGIRAIAEALEDGVVDDPATVARYYATLREDAERLSGLVDDLFELSRAQAGVLQLHLERVSLGDLVSDALAGVASVAGARGVHLEGRLDGPAPELTASAPELLRALRNILDNAIRHTPSDGSVVVEAGRDADAAFVSVVDSGGGIPEADLPRVFDVAFRGDAARTPGAGAGLGLAIALGLVEAHHGEITVRNEARGARFTVRLPLDAAR